MPSNQAPDVWPLEGYFSCGIGFLVTPECLGRTFRSRTANYDVSVALPEIVGEGDAASLRGQPWKYVLEGADRNEASPNGIEWGSIAGGASDSPLYVHVSRCLVHAEVDASVVDEFQSAATQFGDELAVWWDCVCEWLDVLTLQDFASLGRSQRSILNDSIQMWSGDSAGVRKAGVSYQVITGGLHQVEVLDEQQLTNAMDLAASGKRPESEWLFLRDSRSLLNAGDYRRAVIDACTAAELAVTALIDRKFTADGTDPRERKKQFAAHHGLSKLKLLHKKRGAAGALPRRLVDDVGAPRNKAAHRGASLSQAEATTAIKTAAQVVQIAFPASLVTPGVATSVLRRSPRLGILPQNQDLVLQEGSALVLRMALKKEPK